MTTTKRRATWEQRKAKYLAKGKEYLEQQNYDKAAVELKNVLQIDPKPGTSLHWLASD